MIDRLRVERIGEVNLDIEATESLSTETSAGTLELSLLYVKPTKGKLVSAELELLPKHLEMRRSNLCWVTCNERKIDRITMNKDALTGLVGFESKSRGSGTTGGG